MDAHEADGEEDDLDERFPKTEAELIHLARNIAAGFRAHPELFPDPPFSPEELERRVNKYLNSKESQAVSHARLERANAEFERSIDLMVRLARRNDGVTGDEAPPERPTATPGQAGFLELQNVGRETVSLGWSRPKDGGAVEIYVIERRSVSGNDKWKGVAITVRTETTLSRDDPETEYQYRVMAVNKVGEGPTSNVVRDFPRIGEDP